MASHHFSIRDALAFGFTQAYKHIGITLAVAVIICGFSVAEKYTLPIKKVYPLTKNYLKKFASALVGIDTSADTNEEALHFNINLFMKRGLLYLVYLLIITWFYLGAIKAGLNIYDGKIATLGVFFSQFSLYPTALGAYIIYDVICGVSPLIGLLLFLTGPTLGTPIGLLLMITGSILAFRCYFFMHFLVDKKAHTIIDSLKKSSVITGSKNEFKIFLLLFITWSIVPALAGGITAVVGKFAKAPIDIELILLPFAAFIAFPFILAIAYAYRSLAAQNS